jgi:predicted methyltransferase
VAQLEAVYSEVYRTLKPGSIFVAYEWVSTPAYDPTNKGHVAIMDEIIIGNGLPDMRTWAQAEAAGTAVGFKLLKSRDLAVYPDGSITPW